MGEWLWVPVVLGLAGLLIDWYSSRKPRRNMRLDVLYTNYKLLSGDLEFDEDERDQPNQ